MKQRHRGVGGGIASASKPTIAALPGAAVGAGLAIALACDIRIAAQSAFLSGGYSKIGLSGDYGIAWLLTRTVGTSVAREMMFTSDRIDAARAEKLGLVNRVVADAELASAARALAQQIADGPADAIRMMKQNLNEVAVARLFRCDRSRGRADRAAFGVGEPQGGGARLCGKAQARVQQGLSHEASSGFSPNRSTHPVRTGKFARTPVAEQAGSDGSLHRSAALHRRDRRCTPRSAAASSSARGGSKLRHEQFGRRIRNRIADDRDQPACQVVDQLHVRFRIEIALRLLPAGGSASARWRCRRQAFADTARYDAKSRWPMCRDAFEQLAKVVVEAPDQDRLITCRD